MSIKVKFECPKCKEQIKGDLSVWADDHSPAEKERPINLNVHMKGCGEFWVGVKCPYCDEEINLCN